MTCFARNSIDAAEPPEGVRLAVAVIAGRIGVTISELATAAGISRTALWDLISRNVWPARTDAASIQAGLHELLQQRGATPDELERLFHAHLGGRGSRDSERPYLHARQRQRAARPGLAATEPDTEEANMLLAKQTLSPAARKAFALFVNPFDGDVTSDDEMYVNAEIAYVREACLQAAVGGRFVAVVSESGGGKSTIVADLESRIQRDRKPVIVIRPSVLGMEDSDLRGKQLKSTDILQAIVTALDSLATVKQTLEARSKQARDLLARSAEAGFAHLLVVEEAHCMPDATLKHLKRLHEVKLGRKPLLGILLVGQTELKHKLDPKRAQLREVTQRCEIVELLPLDADLKPYLAHRAKGAGRELAQLIDDSGVEELRKRLTVERPGPNGARRASSLIYPLAVNNLVTAALNVAAELGAPLVTRDVVRAV